MMVKVLNLIQEGELQLPNVAILSPVSLVELDGTAVWAYRRPLWATLYAETTYNISKPE